jgi:hypothetical protein
MRFVHSIEHEINFTPRKLVTHVLLKKLGDDLICAREIEKANVRKIQDCERLVSDLVEMMLDADSNRGSRGARDEIRVKVAHASLEHRAHVDVADHASGILSGIVICT